MSIISKGTDVTEFITGLNGGVSIDPTLLGVLVLTAQAVLEEERPWVVLRKTDISKSVTTGNTWQTAFDLSTITDFSRFYTSDTDYAIRIFDGDNRIAWYRLIPFDRRLEFKNVTNTCTYDENTKTLYINGTVAFNGTLYINYISSSTEINLDSASAVWTLFPPRFLPIIGFYAIGIHKGAVDYDSINKLMLPSNQAALNALKEAMENWDNQKQLNSLSANDPDEPYAYPRSGAINRYDDLGSP